MWWKGILTKTKAFFVINLMSSQTENTICIQKTVLSSYWSYNLAIIKHIYKNVLFECVLSNLKWKDKPSLHRLIILNGSRQNSQYFKPSLWGVWGDTRWTLDWFDVFLTLFQLSLWMSFTLYCTVYFLMKQYNNVCIKMWRLSRCDLCSEADI